MKKKSGWKSVCIGLIGAFFLGSLLGLCGCDDEEYDYEYEDRGHQAVEAGNTRPGGSNQPGGLSTGGENEDSLSAMRLSSRAIRDKKVTLKGNGEDTVTVLVYMNGSNLETDSGEATADLSEMVAAGDSRKVNVIVETAGTKKWDGKFGIASDRSQIYKVDGKGLTLLKDDLGQQDCTRSKTLSDFIIWGAQNYPADRYILLFWDHGGGPVYGFGYDEWAAEGEALTLDEMQTALKTAGVYFDFVGMDCCLMSCLEVCCAFYDYCDYMILSEDFESGLGWYYTNWLKTLYQNSSIPTQELGKMICDEMVSANETDPFGDRSIMALIDESMMKVLFTAWTDFAVANEDALLGRNYSRSVKRSMGGRIHPAIAKNSRPNGWNYDFFGYGDAEEAEETSMAEYFVTDIMEVAGSVDSEKSKALSAAIDQTLVYVKSTRSDAGLTGIAVSLPYGDGDYYKSMKEIFRGIGIDESYVNWLENFVGASGAQSSSDHDAWDDAWNGWEDYEEEYDWSDWEYYDSDDSYWDSYDWDNWDYEDSWNEWFDDSYYGEDGWDYQGDDWYYGDDYWYADDWYGDGDFGYGDDWYGGWYDDYDNDWYDDYDDCGSYGGFYDDYGYDDYDYDRFDYEWDW